MMVTDGRLVRDIGEFGLIAALREALPMAARTSAAVTVGIGDDAALWRPPGGARVAVSTDSLVEGVHYRLDEGWSSWADVGHKALAVNLSDLAAMGADPGLATVSLGLRGDERVDDLVAAYDALGRLAAAHGCVVAGGDIVASPTTTSWHVTVLGTVGDAALTRSGAEPGDVIVVSGTLGASAAGLALLGLPATNPRRTATTADLLVAAHLRPEPRVALGQLLARSGATAAMDLSDGLLGDLPRILVASAVSAEVDLAAVPVAAAVRALFPDRWRAMATRGGEDYELLATLPSERAAAIIAAADAIGTTLTPIGTILPQIEGQPALRLRDAEGHVHPADAGAWDHFRQSQGPTLAERRSAALDGA